MAEGEHKVERREPALRAPWPAVALALLIVAAYPIQSLSPSPQGAAERFGFASADPWRDHGAELATSLFVHASWSHALLNALAALAFASPVARRLGTGARGIATLVLLYLISGAVGSLAFAAADARGLLVGASGAVSGLMGAASRLPLGSGDRLLGFASSQVAGMAVAWIIVNLLIAFAGLDVAAVGAPVAWQAHLGGYAAGLLLIGPALRLAGARRG